MGDAAGARLVSRVNRRITLAQLLAGLVGAVDVFCLLWFVLPTPHHPADETLLFVVNAGTLGVFLAVTGAAGFWLAQRWYRPATRWLVEGRAPDAAERTAVLRHPRRLALLHGSGWVMGAVVFFTVNVVWSVALAVHVASTILLGALTCIALSYLFAEKLLRPVTARTLAHGPATPVRPGVKGRLVLTWVSATGVPLFGLLLLGVHTLVDDRGVTVGRLAWAIVALTGIGVMTGLLGTLLVSRAVALPLRGLRTAMAQVEEGVYAARVDVDDASEIGLLQSRFNAMAAGLEERERLRDLFGRHVGEDVAQTALRAGTPSLGGEVREVAVLFVDVIGSTTMAATRPPGEVVALLNEFFADVVAVAARHGGWVNKFEGDAALVVFGAPSDHPDAAGAALRAARELASCLERGPLDAGVGVSAGPAVAGNVGASERFEYTVIGDPVNEAARLCELAKRRPDRVLASAGALDRARNGEADRWARRDEVTLRGRSRPTGIVVPA
jgi:adenylate cyclase